MPTEHQSRHPAVRKAGSFLVSLDSIQIGTIFLPQNTHPKNVSLGGKKFKLERCRDQKKPLGLLLLFELPITDFYCKISNNNLKKIIMVTAQSEHRNWWCSPENLVWITSQGWGSWLLNWKWTENYFFFLTEESQQRREKGKGNELTSQPPKTILLRQQERTRTENSTALFYVCC